MEKQTEKKRKHTKNTDKSKTTTTKTSNLLLSLNVANLAIDNFCYLWRKFDTKKYQAEIETLTTFAFHFRVIQVDSNS